jgi:uncharacterized protein
MNMDITPLMAKGTQVIQSYGGGGFRISDAAYSGAVMVFANETLPWQTATVNSFEFTESDFAGLTEKEGDVEILLLGTGKQQQFLPENLRTFLRRHGMVAEVMDTGAACRTFNILQSEARRVAALLLPVD